MNRYHLSAMDIRAVSHFIYPIFIFLLDHPAVKDVLKRENRTKEYFQFHNTTEVTFNVPLERHFTGLSQMYQQSKYNCPSTKRAHFQFH
ncbi:unnamed protein product [Larinioides sclopetarius]|uniref:Uncharacterized protein n=1 Tax=Larinioides sclopetarius TaxID=280406 RepID=A0AAV2BBP9_9ARAC